MKKVLCVLGLILFPFLANAEIYKWVDEKGRIQYGDRPPETEKAKAKQVEVDVNVVHSERKLSLNPTAPKLPPSESQAATKPTAAQKPEPAENDNSCAAQWERYKKSEACFSGCNGHRTRDGRIIEPSITYEKRRACQKCVDMKKPNCKL